VNVICHVCHGLVDHIGLQPQGVRLCDCQKKKTQYRKRIKQLETETARLQTIIDAAPHDSSCWKGMSRGLHGVGVWECNCWKAESKKASEDA
jgi:hypothetical protein